MNSIQRRIPAQRKGAQSATTYTVKTDGIATAHYLFEKAKKNLLDVNNWQKIAGPSTAEFKVIGRKGDETNGLAEEGNYLRITIPAVPGSPAGEGYDWVRVEKIQKEKTAGYECITMQVRPSVPPFYNKQEVAHFFSKDATSTFFLERRRNRIKAAVYGRNEKPNTAPDNLIDKVRNTIIAVGAMLGFNKPQWKSLVKGWLQHV